MNANKQLLAFCDIQNNQGRGRGYQLKPKGEADNPYQDLDYSRYHKIVVLYLYIERNKKSHVFASLLTASKTTRENLT